MLLPAYAYRVRNEPVLLKYGINSSGKSSRPRDAPTVQNICAPDHSFSRSVPRLAEYCAVFPVAQRRMHNTFISFVFTSLSYPVLHHQKWWRPSDSLQHFSKARSPILNINQPCYNFRCFTHRDLHGQYSWTQGSTAAQWLCLVR